MTTIEGGMIVTDDYITYDFLKSARSHGWVRNSPRSELYPEFENKNYLFDLLGYNFRSTNINAAIGLIQLENLDNSINTRLKNHQYFLEKVSQLNLQSFKLGVQKVNFDETSSFSLAILFESKEVRDYILKNLYFKGIESRPIVAGNLLKQPVFKYKHFRSDKTSMGDKIHDLGIYIPNNQFITLEKVDYIIQSIKELLEEFKIVKNNLNCTHLK